MMNGLVEELFWLKWGIGLISSLFFFFNDQCHLTKIMIIIILISERTKIRPYYNMGKGNSKSLQEITKVKNVSNFKPSLSDKTPLNPKRKIHVPSFFFLTRDTRIPFKPCII